MTDYIEDPYMGSEYDEILMIGMKLREREK
ncbi:hypothetical protein ES708_34253 [subsurface metagenome]